MQIFTEIDFFLVFFLSMQFYANSGDWIVVIEYSGFFFEKIVANGNS